MSGQLETVIRKQKKEIIAQLQSQQIVPGAYHAVPPLRVPMGTTVPPWIPTEMMEQSIRTGSTSYAAADSSINSEAVVPNMSLIKGGQTSLAASISALIRQHLSEYTNSY